MSCNIAVAADGAANGPILCHDNVTLLSMMSQYFASSALKLVAERSRAKGSGVRHSPSLGSGSRDHSRKAVQDSHHRQWSKWMTQEPSVSRRSTYVESTIFFIFG
ncbi:Piso0_004959 [Millerozyma farinosa CBS 7064]|uniref:Piso0_004959 protein n=1 Tax=Pichia sorbitophila (strain ATCC MYA-4447 / BCRC 22081 / CBS 7064 / NBRC 10061 / NRRL Y-12695) TaxID=559304 RepID=G8Y3V1_PICSO|nr:Piso0_004959 [Millerozyma farinosa CBS 7064]